MRTLEHGWFRSVVLFALLVISMFVTSCTGVSSASRHHVYTSLDELIGDSVVVVEGKVVAREKASDGGSPATDATVLVTRQFAPPGLAQHPIGPDPSGIYRKPLRPVAARVVVRQPDEAPATPLQQGVDYVLFLVPAGLAGDDPNLFHVTGGVAGMYMANSGRYVAVHRDGDGTPEVLDVRLLGPTRTPSLSW